MSRTRHEESRGANAFGVGAIGATLGGLMGGPPGALIGGVIGAFLGHDADPDE